jgi:hypothetical protein
MLSRPKIQGPPAATLASASSCWPGADSRCSASRCALRRWPADVRPYAGAAPQPLDHGIAAGVAQRDEGRAAGNDAAHGLHAIGRAAHPGRIMRWAGEHMLVPAPDPRGRCQAGSLQRHGFIAGVDEQQLGAALGHGGDHALFGRGNGGAHGQAQAAVRHVGQARPDAA